MEEDTQTKFNVAVASLERLHSLLIECNTFSRLCRINGYDPLMLEKWKVSLFAVYREIVPKLTPEEETNLKGKFMGFKKMGNIIGVKYNPRTHQREKIINTSIFNKHWFLLHNIEIYVRKLADSKGMLIPNKQGVKNLLGEMD